MLCVELDFKLDEYKIWVQEILDFDIVFRHLNFALQGHVRLHGRNVIPQEGCQRGGGVGDVGFIAQHGHATDGIERVAQKVRVDLHLQKIQFQQFFPLDGGHLFLGGALDPFYQFVVALIQHLDISILILRALQGRDGRELMLAHMARKAQNGRGDLSGEHEDQHRTQQEE